MFHTYFIKLGFEFDMFALTALVDMYSKLGMLVFAHQVFDEIVAVWISYAHPKFVLNMFSFFILLIVFFFLAVSDFEMGHFIAMGLTSVVYFIGKEVSCSSCCK